MVERGFHNGEYSVCLGFVKINFWELFSHTEYCQCSHWRKEWPDGLNSRALGRIQGNRF
jgi:hypothetical protein